MPRDDVFLLSTECTHFGVCDALHQTPKGNDVSELEITDLGITPKDLNTVSYDVLMADGNLAYELESSGLLGKQALVGVPFVITGVTYQYVEPLPAATVAKLKKAGKPAEDPRGFVSIDAVVGNVPALERAIKRGAVPGVDDVKALPVDPEERIVFNDGGTGIRRQITMLLDQAGIITVGNGEPAANRRLDRRFDLPWWKWEVKPSAENMVEMGENTIPHITRNHVGTQLLIPARRGLHVSRYSDDVFGDAETYYLG
jgi:hypothetical protein